MKVLKYALCCIALMCAALYALYLKQVDHPFVYYEHDFAVCAIFKNEAPYLKEWIDYHHQVLGSTRFYLYNNDSSDNYKEVLKPYVEKGLVELIEWNSTEEHALDVPEIDIYSPWDRYQIGAYTDCCRNRALGKVRWLAVHDIDEYIVPPEGASSFKKMLEKALHPPLKKFLKRPFYRRRFIGCMQIHWLLFGTSHVWDVAHNERLTEKLYLRAPDDYCGHTVFKSIYRPEAIDVCLVHHAYLNKPQYRSKNISHPQCRIHHYWSGPEKKLIEKRKVSQEELKDLSERFNCVEDRTITTLFPARGTNP